MNVRGIAITLLLCVSETVCKYMWIENVMDQNYPGTSVVITPNQQQN